MPILHWLNDEEARKTSSQIPYRLLEADPKLSFGDLDSENMLIQGDNLEALKALLPYYAGQVKCIFIDPPYNTQSAFEHYDDNLEHSIWLSVLYPRIELLRDLLAEEGSVWVVIDENEGHYLKVIMDEIFHRKNFVASIVWQKVFAKKNKALISGSHDTILVYAKNANIWDRNLLGRSEKNLKAFKNPDNDPRGKWQSVAYSVQSEDSEKRAAYRYEITLPSGRKVLPPVGRHWNGLPERTEELRNDNKLGRHYYGNTIGAFDTDEEFECAKAIAECEDVKFWVRNLVHDTWAFRLPLSNGKFFYPDFVALLNDGRIFVIEYKGQHLVDSSQEKKNIGELWEEKSGEKALFLLAVDRDGNGRNVRKQIDDKISGE